MDAVTVDDMGVPVSEDVELATPCTHFLHVGLEFLEQDVVRRDGDDGHFVGDECQWPVLEFSRRIGFGMDVGDFLEFQGSFQCNGVMDAPAKEECIVEPGELVCPADDLGLERKDGGNSGRQVP